MERDWSCWCAARRCRPWSRRCLLCPTATGGPFDFLERNKMSETRFTDQHEWVRLEGGEAVVGITKFAADSLGDVVFVELPEKGREVGAGAEAAVVESVKAPSEVYAPVSGEVSDANSALEAAPAKVNE